MGSLLEDMEATWAKNAKEPFTPFIKTGFDHLRKACVIMDELVKKYGETKKGLRLDEAGGKRLREAFVEAEMAQLFAGSEDSVESKYIVKIARDVLRIQHSFKN